MKVKNYLPYYTKIVLQRLPKSFSCILTVISLPLKWAGGILIINELQETFLC